MPDWPLEFPARRSQVERGQMPAAEKVTQVRGGAHKGVSGLFHIRVPLPSLPVSCRRYSA